MTSIFLGTIMLHVSSLYLKLGGLLSPSGSFGRPRSQTSFASLGDNSVASIEVLEPKAIVLQLA